MNLDFNNIFGGFGGSLQPEQPQPEKETAPILSGIHVETTAVEKTIGRDRAPLTEEEKKAYAEYRSGALSYNQKLNHLYEVHKADALAKRKKRELNDVIQELESEEKSKLKELEQKKNDFIKTKNNALNVLNQQSASNRNIIHPVDRPVIQDSIVSYFINAAQRGLMTKNQLQYMQQEPELICGSGRPIASIQTLKSKEEEFYQTDEFKSLVSGRPSDKYIQKIASKISLIISAILFAVILLGGFKLGFILNVVEIVCFLFLFVVLGVILSGICIVILSSVKSLSDNTASLIGFIVGFFVFGLPLSSAMSHWVAGLLSGSFVVAAIIGFLVAIVNWIVVYCVFSMTPFIRWAHKLPFLKNIMIRGTFAELEKTANLNESIYCVLNHDEICQFFEDSSIREEIKTLEDGIRYCDNQISTLNHKINDVELDYSARIDGANGDLKKVDRALMEIHTMNGEANKAVAQCIEDIKQWEKQPELDMMDSYELQDSICFEHTTDENGISILKYDDCGIAVHYRLDQEAENVEFRGNVIKQTLNAFTKMYPKEMLSIAVISLNEGAPLRRYAAIDWMSEQADFSGGVGKITKGTVRLVANADDFKSYVKLLETQISDWEKLEITYSNDLNDLRRCDQASLAHFKYVNRYMFINREHGKSPMSYQVILIFQNSFDLDNDSGFLRMLNEQMGYGGIIPVFLINDSAQSTGKYPVATSSRVKLDTLISKAKVRTTLNNG